MLFKVTVSLALLLAVSTRTEASPNPNYQSSAFITNEIANTVKEYVNSSDDLEMRVTELAAKVYDLLRYKCDLNREVPKMSNIALNKVAVQTSVCCGDAWASRAVDGNLDGNFFHDSVTHTNKHEQTYWRVDLGASCVVQKVVIYNRVDCCGERLQIFDVILEDFAFRPLKSYYFEWGELDKFEFGGSDAPLVGGVEHVRIRLRRKDFLSLAEVQVFGRCNAARTRFDNVALGKYAYQSSTHEFVKGDPPVAAKAVDGNTFNKRSGMTHTTNEAGAWWEVDLRHTAEIESILLFNRFDCCRERLVNFNVTLYNFAHETVATFHEAGGSKDQLEYGFVVAPPKKVHFIRVQLLGTNYLSLAEVEVFGKQLGGYENIALGKLASQSSDFHSPHDPIADKAVDGLVEAQIESKSSTHTNNDTNAWWEVDLRAEEIVYGVTIYNRVDCCGERLQNFDVFLTDESGKVTHTAYFGAKTLVTYPVYIPSGVAARKVKVQLRGTNYLTLAEVQIWAGSRTCGGTGNGARCVFPFTHDGVEYDTCTTAGGNRPWCATKTGDLSAHDEWGFCFC